MKNWVEAEVWTNVTVNVADGCDATPSGESGVYNGANGTTDGTANDGACATICGNLPAWGMTNNLPSGGSPTSGGNAAEFAATHCYGYSFSANVPSCTLM